MYPVCIYIVQGVSVSRILHVSSVYLHPEYGMYPNTAIPIFVNLNIPRYTKHELRNMIKICIVIRLSTLISILANLKNTYIKLYCAINM